MPQGFPDPYSAFSEGFRGSFFPMMQLIGQRDREKREADERKQEAERKKEAADNKTVMNAVHLYQQGMTDLAVKMAESTGKFAKGEAAAGFKQLNQLPEEWKKAIGEMSADDPVTAAVFGRYMKMDPKVSGPFVLQILKNWQEQKGKTDTKKFLEDEIRRAGGGGAAAGPAPVAPGTALAQSGAQAAPAPEFQGTEAGGRGSTALAQRLLEARPATAPSAVPAAPAIPGAPAATPPATDLSSLNSAALRRIQAKLVQRGKKADVALADKIGVLAKSAEDREGKSEKAPTTRQVVRGGETITEEWNPQTKKFEEIARGPRFQERPDRAPTTREVKRGEKIFTQQWNPETKKFEDIGEAPRFQEKVIDPSARAAAIRSTTAASVNQALTTRRGPLGEIRLETMSPVDKAKFNINIKKSAIESLKAQGIKDIKMSDLPADPMNFFYGDPKLTKPDAVIFEAQGRKYSAGELAAVAKSSNSVNGLRAVLTRLDEAEKARKITRQDKEMIEARILLRLNELGAE